MLKIDGKELDLTNPQSFVNITIKEGGYIEQTKDGQTVRVTKEELDKAEEAKIRLKRTGMA
jgi:hypothetical protein